MKHVFALLWLRLSVDVRQPSGSLAGAACSDLRPQLTSQLASLRRSYHNAAPAQSEVSIITLSNPPVPQKASNVTRPLLWYLVVRQMGFTPLNFYNAVSRVRFSRPQRYALR